MIIEDGFEIEGVRFYAADKPCVVVFKEGEHVVMFVTFMDVQEASEYLSLCEYRKDKRYPAVWNRDKGERAFVLYVEGDCCGKNA